jgi:hypothetical protein
MNVRLQVFKGMAPMLDEGLLHNEQAIEAVDADLRFGNLRALRAPTVAGDVPASAKTIFRRRAGGAWISSDNAAHFVESTLADDQFHRLYSSMEGADGFLRMRYAVLGEQKNVRLGVEAPDAAAAVETAEKQATTWSRQWGFFWEEPDGTLSGQKTKFSAVDASWDGQVVAVEHGSRYSIPASIAAAAALLKPSGASSRATLAFFFEAWSASGALLGRVYPEQSALSADRDLFINGFKVSAVQSDSGGDILFALAYDETDVEEYTADRVYLFAYVDEVGEESAPSPPSATLSVRPDRDVRLEFPAFEQPEDRAPVVKRRLYRTATGSESTEYQFVADVAIEQSGYVDSLTDLELGETIPGIGWLPPPAGLKGLCAVPGGFLAAYSGETVYFSAVNAPHAWPDAYAVACDSPIRGLAVVGVSVYVLTNEQPELITASAPDATERAKVPYAQNCTSERSITTASGGVLFASPDGLCQIAGMQVVILSHVFLSKERWRQMQTDADGVERPEETVFAVYDEILYVFAAGGSWTWDLVKPDRGLVELSVRATAARYVPTDDGLYLASEGRLLRWADKFSGSSLQAVWRSKRFGFSSPLRFRRARISAEGPATLVLRDYFGAQVYRIERESSRSFLLPPMAPRRWWQIELRTSGAVTECSIGTSAAEM